MNVRGDAKLLRAVVLLDDCGKGECVFQREPTTRKVELGQGGLMRLGRRGVQALDLRKELARAYGVLTSPMQSF